MRYLFGFLCVSGLCVMPLVGCGEGGEGGAGGMAGTGGSGGNGIACQDNVCPCTEAGIRAAIAEGVGPFTFDCDGPTTVVTEAEIVIDNDVILDGEGILTVDGNQDHFVLQVQSSTVELRGFTVTKGGGLNYWAGGIWNNGGTLTLTNSTVSGNTIEARSFDIVYSGGGIFNLAGTLTLTNSTVSGNTVTGNQVTSGGILNFEGTLTLTNSTVSGNTGFIAGGIYNDSGTVQITNSTVSGNTGDVAGGVVNQRGETVLANTLVDDDCSGFDEAVSGGYNLESPGNTCGFDQLTDQVSVPDPMLGPLQDNGGPTQTHALLPGSVAIDQIPAVDCVDAEGAPLTTDQRGEPRPETGGTMCDVGAFEVQP